MTTMTDVAFDLLVVEQLHDVVPCDWQANTDYPCDRTAHWLTVCPECGDVVVLCSPHRVVIDGYVAIRCSGHSMPLPLPWRAL